MMFVVVQMSIHVQDVDEVDGVVGGPFLVGVDVIEVVVLALIPQDSVLVRDGRIQVEYTFDDFGVD